MNDADILGKFPNDMKYNISFSADNDCCNEECIIKILDV